MAAATTVRMRLCDNEQEVSVQVEQPLTLEGLRTAAAQRFRHFQAKRGRLYHSPTGQELEEGAPLEALLFAPGTSVVLAPNRKPWRGAARLQEGEHQARDSAASRPAAAAAGPTDTPRPEQTDYADDLMAVPHVNPKCTTCSHDEVERLVKRVSDRIATGSTQLGVVVLPGSFNPPHRDHLRCLELAREHLEAQGVAVLAGFLQPSSDGYVAGKVGAAEAMRLRHRVLACHIAAREAGDWIGVWCSGDMSGSSATARCGKFCSTQAQHVLGPAGLRDITAYQVCGADFVARSRGWSRPVQPPRMVIARPGTVLPREKPASGWFVASTDYAGNASSTEVRKLIHRGKWDELVSEGWAGRNLAAFLRSSFEQGELFMEQ